MNDPKKPSKEPEGDRRQHARFRTKAFLGVPVNIKPMPPFFGEAVMGQMIDLSAGGMSMYLPESIPVGTNLDLHLTFPDRTKLHCNARIVRAVPQKGRFTIGLQFLDLPDFMRAKLDKNTRDFLECEERIKAKEADICFLNCSFFNLCDKLEKINKTHEIELEFQMRLRKSNDQT